MKYRGGMNDISTRVKNVTFGTVQMNVAYYKRFEVIVFRLDTQ